MPGHYDLWTVFCSFVIAFLAGFVAFESVDHSRVHGANRGAVFFGGVTLGLGIWSMHFIGMQAWRPPYPLYYAVDRTVLSVVVAVCASWLALYLVARNQMSWDAPRSSLWIRGVGAVLVGTGICAMHYIGMSALKFSGPVMWDPFWITYSFLIAVSASWAAMEMLDRSGDGIKDLRPRVLASAVIAVAICGMHYAGMCAFMPAQGAVSLPSRISLRGETLAQIGVGNAMLFLFALLVVSYRDKAQWVQAAMEAQLENAESVRKLEGLATAGKIAASVAHEINNPLEAVTNLLFLVQMGQIGENEKQYLEMAQKELERIGSITTHTLRFYRQQSSAAPVSIPELLESALTLFQSPLMVNKVTVVREWPEWVPQVVCREGEIRQVVANLISNAIDAMPHGGTLRLAILPELEGLLLEIADTGKGIPAEVRGKILEPFFTTKGHKGTGLGLSISAEIIARHGGTLRFDSTTGGAAGTGSCFRIYLPYSQDQTAAAEEPLRDGLGLQHGALGGEDFSQA